MTIQQASYTYLAADSTLMAYLGGVHAPTTTQGRLYWQSAPDGATLPYVVYYMAGDTDAQEFLGTINTGQGIITFDVVTDENDRTNGLTIRDRIRALMRYQAGTHGTLVMNQIIPKGIRDNHYMDTHRCIFSADYEVHCEY
jgi:hypothetical protein